MALPSTVASADKSFNSGKGTTWDCAKDDDISINTSSGTYTFKGTCSEISVNGGNNQVTIESVEDLSVGTVRCGSAVGSPACP